MQSCWSFSCVFDQGLVKENAGDIRDEYHRHSHITWIFQLQLGEFPVGWFSEGG
ncbi:hypothetical protein HMPREF0044_0181 [Gleimia coleocanis DSM 15436]|uniref:Uncharacterized protein n=1 Tax=Gleimia coleocanis DSM 15436 TaxID=525245 RepID=C0VYE1_9ACTO|nr:hypothetical protein HMPREF0044_0181 [Gleimia coleocanis DSM 15436]